ncbi:MAG: hypothetical protein J6V88_00500, partial [Kiritimatiellae bacterium]|nr:hypothetical protein [Kiritimatiellia bacterium]
MLFVDAVPHAAKATIKPNTKRCAAEDVLLRTFCPFSAQGLGGWCAGMVWEWVKDGAGGRKNASGQDGGWRNEKRQ